MESNTKNNEEIEEIRDESSEKKKETDAGTKKKHFGKVREFTAKITGKGKPPIRITKHIRIKRPRLVWGIVLTALLLVLILSHTGLFLNNSEIYSSTGILLYVLCIIMALASGLAASLSIMTPRRFARIYSFIMYFGAPFVAALMTECLQGIFIYVWSPQTFLLNYLMFLVMYSIVSVFTGGFRKSIIILTPILFAFGFAFSLIMTFRGTPLMPADLVTIKTGMDVASNYKFKVTYNFIVAVCIFVLFEELGFRMPKLRIRKKYHRVFRVVSLAVVICVCVPFYMTSVAANNGIKPDFWNQTRGYKKTGSVFNFMLNTRYLIVEKPSGYNASDIPGIMNKVIDADKDDPGIFESSKEMQAKQAESAGSTDQNATDQTADSTADSTQTVPNDSNALTITTQAAEAAANESNGTDATGNIASDMTGNVQNSAESQDGTAGQSLPNTGKDTKLAVQYTSDTNQPATSATLKEGEMPDIIVIMNETFSDLRMLGEFSTNQDYMPFLRNLTKNTIKGNLYMPVNGAGTSNSEFEFLTGNSMAFLPSGSNAYELYIKSKLPSLARTLGSQGYSRTAYHTYYKSSWNRNTNYPLLGFENFYALEDILDRNTVEQYRDGKISLFEFQHRINELYPDQNVLLRRFVSDSYDYKVLEQMYENRDQSRPFFLFNVTMQNHGSYDLSYSNFNQQIKITSTDKYYPRANRYLSLIYESDKALSELVDYYSHVSRPVMIVMFGDHQPSIEDSFVESLLGSSLSDLTVSQNQKRFVTPFMIWTNYKSESGYVEKMSVNYLSTLVLQQAGLSGTDYNKYLSAMYRNMPVIDTTGYITSDNKYYTYDDDTKYTSTLDGYKKIVYNYMFDQINKDSDQFYLQDGSSTSTEN